MMSVLEAADGSIVGVEVKAGATVRRDDFRGLRLLAEKAGNRFRAGIVVYTGQESLAFGEMMHSVPMSAIWATAGGN